MLMQRKLSNSRFSPTSAFGGADEAQIEPAQGMQEESSGFKCKALCIPFFPIIALLLLVAGFFTGVRSGAIDMCRVFNTCRTEDQKVMGESCSGHVNSGDEGYFKGSEPFRLQHVVMNIRHGDRSTLFHIPGLIKHDDDGNQGINSKEVKYMSNLSAFKLQPLEDYEHIFDNPLDVKRLDGLARREIEQGKLTVTGFQQHVTLGRHLKYSYFNFLQQIKSADQIFIRSTNFERTIQSASALMIGMVPRLTRPDRRGDLTIHYHPYKRDEAMHGVGLRRKSGLQVCPRAVAAREKQFRSNRSFDLSVTESDDIVSVFGKEGVAGQRIVDMVDVMIPGYCQGGHLPCRYTDRQSGEQKCMTMESMAEMKRRADTEFCNTYGGSDGGELSSRLAMYPFLMQVKRSLFYAADLDVDYPDDNFLNNMGKVEPKLGPDRSFGSRLEREMMKHRETPKGERSPDKDVKFTLYSGHDTVIAPVLAALGVYHRYCTWPPYASHIAFELWKNARKESLSRPQNETIRDHYVRVLFNGRDVTRHIPSCARAAARAAEADKAARFKRPTGGRSGTGRQLDEEEIGRRELDELGANTQYRLGDPPPKYRDPSYEKRYDSKNLCSLTAFAEQIDGLLDGAPSMTEACQLK